MIRIGHVVDHLRGMPEHSVQCAVTSPPYYGLRDYGLDPVIWAPVQFSPMPGMTELLFPAHADPVRFPNCDHEWDVWEESHNVRETATKGKTRTTERSYGGDATRRFDGNHQKHAHGQTCRKCGAWRGCLGLEPDPNLYIGHLVQVFREVRRVLRKDGTLWLNLGDSYANGGRKTRDADDKLTARGMGSRSGDPFGIKPKDMLGIPWRAAFALQANGWWLRSDIVWEKPNAMPESVTDRPTRSHEMVFLLTPSNRYFYDHHAIMEKAVQDSRGKAASFKRDTGNKREQVIPGQSKGTHRPDRPSIAYNLTRNKRDVWTVSTKPYNGAHFAVFPPDLVEPMIRAGTSEAGACPHCGKPWTRITECDTAMRATKAAGWEPGCACQKSGPVPGASPVPCVVLDPFGGSGTTAMVAQNLGRQWEIIEANPHYAPLAEERLLVSGRNRARHQRTAHRSTQILSQLEIF
ncbi:DNA-methyltransferase [Acidithiobacillus ferrooxidans]|uniref:DNA-methyltransferase n=1 Tax=Acidithiobacillus ferrooxidans TaxID=920 RepID=UPI0019441E5B|nr:site-specific DNA-methyltransferase [Acidithiobacillus ferrooxidans]